MTLLPCMLTHAAGLRFSSGFWRPMPTPRCPSPRSGAQSGPSSQTHSSEQHRLHCKGRGGLLCLRLPSLTGLSMPRWCRLAFIGAGIGWAFSIALGYLLGCALRCCGVHESCRVLPACLVLAWWHLSSCKLREGLLSMLPAASFAGAGRGPTQRALPYWPFHSSLFMWPTAQQG